MEVAMRQWSDGEQLALETYVKLMRAAESVTARLESGLREAGLTTTQFGVLEAVYHLGPLSQGELARKNLKSSGNLTLVVDNLERRGLVVRRRDPTDRRRVGVRLTPRGEELIAELFPRHARAIADTFSALEPEDQRELARLCRRLGLAAASAAATG
jgi:MarR family 2-MHQ and catechol resistance regulon transcriptional repressor